LLLVLLVLLVLLLHHLQPDGSAWRADPTVAERTLLGLAVDDCGLALINGALPSSFDPQHTPRSWWMEAIFKVSKERVVGNGVWVSGLAGVVWHKL
jgi:hypothetical protein